MKRAPAIKITFDASSVRRFDENGFLHVAASHISKETINPYYGQEIPRWRELGLEPERVYYAYRSGAALAEGAATFNGLPLLMGHYEDSAENPQKEFRVGSLGTDAAFKAPYLDNSLIITDAQAINMVESGLVRELSAAYYFDPDFRPGEFEGQPYDFVMTNIRGNHVALVEDGRAGPDVLVADRNPRGGLNSASFDSGGAARPSQTTLQDKKGLVMNLLEKLKEFFASLISEGAKAEEIKAALGQALPEQASSGQASPESAASEQAAEGPAEAEAKDNGEGGGGLAKVMELIKSLSPEEFAAFQQALAGGEPAGGGESGPPMEPAGDEDEGASKEGEEIKGTADAKFRRRLAADMAAVRSRAKTEAVAEITALMRAKSQAAEAVRPLAGSLDIMAFDTAGDIYRHALKARGLTVKTRDLDALKDMVALELRHAQSEAAGPAFDAGPGPLEGPFAHLGNIKISAH